MYLCMLYAERQKHFCELRQKPGAEEARAAGLSILIQMGRTIPGESSYSAGSHGQKRLG